MTYKSVYRTIAHLAPKNGFWSYNIFVDTFIALENETRRRLRIETASPLPDQLKDFFDYTVEEEFWFRYFVTPHRKGKLKKHLGPFPGIPVCDPRLYSRRDAGARRPRVQSRTFEVKCLQRNVLRAFLGPNDRYVKELSQNFSGNLFFHAEKRVDGRFWIWVEPRDGLVVTQLVKEHLEEAHRLLIAYAGVEREMLPHLEDFIEEYEGGKFACGHDAPVPKAEDEVMDDAEEMIAEGSQPQQSTTKPEAGLPVRQPVNPLKRIAATSEEEYEYEEERRDAKRLRTSHHASPIAPVAFKQCANLHAKFHQGFQNKTRPKRDDGPIMPGVSVIQGRRMPRSKNKSERRAERNAEKNARFRYLP